jgi:site-specific DNA-adenine methylase
MMSKNQVYLEPFVGAAWIVSNMKVDRRYASDTNPYLIELYKALQEGWQPPADVGEELYKDLRRCTGKQKQDGPQVPLEETPDFLGDGKQLALIGFAGCACSFAGIWYGSYARDPRHPGMNFAEKGKKTLIRLKQHISGNKAHGIKPVEFRCCSYDKWNVKGAMIYCDPPYNSTNQPYFSKTFDTDKFWETMRKWSEHNTVVISEYSAPDDFPVIASLPTKTKIDCKTAADAARAEKIFSKTPYEPFGDIFDD